MPEEQNDDHSPESEAIEELRLALQENRAVDSERLEAVIKNKEINVCDYGLILTDCSM
eukprot:CAMPEP_0170504814 /NCGR_PEP_ID=MMETSP0208-20121228/48996_1 /TAXON_ID=197538 /ORGANISM="Strombidium inclinatum, Strain S3" /LENGTH=57 /DNA_ID=CAMNT_0010785269 /DNA_START=173 /DNA_END=343 /DNA_ORIENTATION=-